MSGFEMFLGFITGLAFFLYGMKVLGDGLEKMSGGKLESILERLTSTPLKGILLGAGVTAVIQSSSATTVVGFSVKRETFWNLKPETSETCASGTT